MSFFPTVTESWQTPGGFLLFEANVEEVGGGSLILWFKCSLRSGKCHTRVTYLGPGNS